MRRLAPLIVVAACGGKPAASAPKAPAPEPAPEATWDGPDEWNQYGGVTYAQEQAQLDDALGTYEPPPPPPPPPAPPDLTGTWDSGCGASSTHGEYRTFTFQNTSSGWDLTVATFTDAACTTRTRAVHTAGTYAFGAQAGDAWEVSFAITARDITADDKKAAKAVAKACGLKKLKAGVATDILAKGCTKLGYKAGKDCDTVFDLASDDTGLLRFGGTPGDTAHCAADQRPTALDTSLNFQRKGDSGTGVQECDDLFASFDAFVKCDKIPQAARDAILQSRDAFTSSFGDPTTWDEPTRSAYAQSCKTTDDGIKQALSAMGC